MDASHDEEKGRALSALLKKQYETPKAKAHAVVNHAKRLDLPLAHKVQVNSSPSPRAGILKSPTTASGAQSRISSVNNAGTRNPLSGSAQDRSSVPHQQRVAGKKILPQSLEQFREDGAEPGAVMPQLDSIEQFKPGAHGIFVITGKQLQPTSKPRGWLLHAVFST